MAEIEVHSRIHERHPEIFDEDVIVAWNRSIRMTRRVECYDDNFVAAGFDSRGRLLEMVAVQKKDGGWMVFHAMRATDKVLLELGLTWTRGDR